MARGKPIPKRDLDSANAILHEAMRAEAKKEITVKQSGTTQKVTKEQALVRTILDKGLTGGPHFARLALNALKEANQYERERLEQDHELWGAVKARNSKLLKELPEDNADPFAVIPHPDDIIIEPDKPVRFDGPINARQVEEVREQILRREAFLIEDNLWRMRDKRRRDYTIDPWGPFFLALLEDRALPKRLQWGSDVSLDVRDRYMTGTERELSKLRRQIWKGCGVTAPRDDRLVDAPDMQATMQPVSRVLKEMLTADDPTTWTLEEIVQMLKDELNA